MKTQVTELCHLLREHAERGALFDDPLGWNLAADAEINDDLRKESICLPGAPIYPERLGQPDGRLAEEYYAALPKAHVALLPSGPGGGRCGSAASGRAEPWEGPEAGDREVPPTLNRGEQIVIRHQVAVAIWEYAREAGSLPAHWERWAGERLEARVDWRTELASLVRRAVGDAVGAVDYRYDRPSRRQSCFGRIVIPSLRRPIPRVGVIVDTSGSMDDELLGAALGELEGVLRVAAGREAVAVLAVDAAVQSCQRIFRPEQVALSGGGGTDMGAGLAAVEHLRPRPQVAVVLTDGFTPWPERPPRGIQTIVVLLDERGSAPYWARTMTITESALGRLGKGS